MRVWRRGDCLVRTDELVEVLCVGARLARASSDCACHLSASLRPNKAGIGRERQVQTRLDDRPVRERNGNRVRAVPVALTVVQLTRDGRHVWWSNTVHGAVHPRVVGGVAVEVLEIRAPLVDRNKRHDKSWLCGCAAVVAGRLPEAPDVAANRTNEPLLVGEICINYNNQLSISRTRIRKLA